MAKTFVKLMDSILTSSIWSEDDKTRILWITLLALADIDGYVGASVDGLAHTARMTIKECERSLKKLMSPDPYSRSETEDGRRILEAERGWRIVNFDYFLGAQSVRAREEKREGSRTRQRRFYAKNAELVKDLTDKTKSKTNILNKRASRFEEFWCLYPKKRSKKYALKSWMKLEMDDILFEKIIDSVKAHTRSKEWQKDDGQFIPYPASFLNQEMWNDEMAVVKKEIRNKCRRCGRELPFGAKGLCIPCDAVEMKTRAMT